MCSRKLLFNNLAILVLPLAMLFVNTDACLADVKLPAVISDNMVLQQGAEVPIWGWAEPGEKVEIGFGKYNQVWNTATDANGRWIIKIGPFTQSGALSELTIKGNNTVVLKNVLVGEVWVCSGQSNMEWPVKQAANSDEEIASANYPKIRMFTVSRRVANTPQTDCQGKWLECTPETAGSFSAVGYFFGRELHKQLNTPIGLIHASWGGTPAESWIRKDVLESDQDFVPILVRYEKAVKDYPEATKRYKEELKKYEQTAFKAKAEGKKAPRRPDNLEKPIGPNHHYSPYKLYNGMITPLIPYAIKGAIWYQGESNAGRAYQYRKLFPALIQNWRNDWGQGDFPFIFVQLANYMQAKAEPAESEWAELREAQLMTLSLPNTAMAVIIDIGEANDIHPKNKQDVGKRLALPALAEFYGKDLVYSGPIYKSMQIDGNKIIIHFDHIGSGLVSKDNKQLTGFAIAGSDKKFVWADAEIVGDTIVVSSDKVSEPVAVRYAWADNPICNLYNKQGLPASPFRTDDWQSITLNNK